MSQENICVLCGKEWKDFRRLGRTERYWVECDICGKYVSNNFEDLQFRAMPQEDRAMVSAFTRELFEYSSPEPELDILSQQNQIEVIVQRYKSKSISEKLGNFILFLARKTHFYGEEIPIDFLKDFPITYSKADDEFSNIFLLSRELGFIEAPVVLGPSQQVKLTLQGWQKSEEIKEHITPSRKCFVAMSCSGELREAYEAGIKSAVEAAGYKPVFIEREEHNEKICDLIIAEIRTCKFVIADVTGQRQNVYYEAGFAQGINREVIWTCRRDEIDSVHFDTRQYNHIVWENPTDLKKKLFNRIKATII